MAVGELVVLIGESGCGKTTLLRMFNRMVAPTQGSLWLRGESIQEQDPVELRRRTGYVQQEGGLLPHWTVNKNVAMVPTLLDWNASKVRDRVGELLSLVGLEPKEYGERFPAELSGGQRQRVAVARALAADPEVILLDEPFGALDAITRLEIQTEFLDLRNRLGKTMILVTHDLDEAFRLGHRIAVMKNGRILQCAPPQELKDSPAHSYVKTLVQHLGPQP